MLNQKIVEHLGLPDSFWYAIKYDSASINMFVHLVTNCLHNERIDKCAVATNQVSGRNSGGYFKRRMPAFLRLSAK